MTSRHDLPSGLPLQVAGEATSARSLIVIQEAFGVTAHIKEVTERFSAHGFYAVAPELFYREGPLEVSYDNFPDAMATMAQLTREGLDADLRATTQWLVSQGYSPSSIGVVGYCMGGSVAFYCATLGIVGASVTFYGGGILHGRFGVPPLVELAPSLQCAWLGLYGDLDKGIPVEQVEELRAATAAVAATTDVVRYANADHGFNCDARPAVFNAHAANDATRRAIDFLNAHLTER